MVSLGLLLTVTLFTAGPLYMNTIERLAFSQFLDGQRNDLDPQLYTSFSSFAPDQFEADRALVRSAGEDTLGEALAGVEVYATSNLISTRLTQPEGRASRTFLTIRTGFDDHVSVVEGRAARPALTGPLEVVIGSDAAQRIGLTVGQEFHLNTNLPPPNSSFDAVLAGIVAPNDVSDPYWAGAGGRFYATMDSAVDDNGRWLIYMFVPRETLVNRVGVDAPAQLGTINDTLYLDPAALLTMGASRAEGALVALEGRLASDVPRATFISRTATEISTFQSEVTLNRMPLLIVFILVLATAIYALVMISVTLGRRQEGAVALFRSRGAGVPATVLLGLLWALGVVVAGLAIVPVLAIAAVRGLGYTPGWQAVLDTEALTPAPFLAVVPWLVAGAVMSAVVIALPSAGIARIPIAVLQSVRSRPASVLWFQRIFLDVLVLALAGAVLWQLQIRGADAVIAVTDADAGPSIDRATLIVPLLSISAGVLVFYRFLPLFVRVVAFGARWKGVLPFALAFERIGRAAAPAAVLGGLLFLVSVLGAFTATFGGTLDRAGADHAVFLAGRDVRIDRYGGFDGMSSAGVRNAFTALDGVEDASATYHSSAGTGSIQVGTLVPILGVDPGSIADVVEFREDFSDVPMADLLIALALVNEAVVAARTVPDGTASVGVWVRPETPRENRFLWLQIIDANGTPDTYSLGPLDFSGWRLLETNLARRNQPAPPGPYTVASIMIYEPVQGATGAPGSLILDDIIARDHDGVMTVVDNFARPSDWLPVLVTGERRDLVESAGPIADHASALRFAWGRETRDGVRGVYVSPGASSIPVLASERYLAFRGQSVGDTTAVHVAGRIVPIRIVGRVHQFPTLEDRTAGFLVANGDTLLSHLNAVNVARDAWPNQVFLTLTPDPERRAEVLDEIASRDALAGTLIDGEALRAERQASPLASAGWRGLTVLALVAGICALLLGVAAHATATASGRALEMAVLRALGLSRGKALASFLTEYATITVPAVVAGVALGLYLSQVLVPRFQGLQGAPAVPSLILSPDWRIAGFVTAAVVIAAMGVALILWRGYLTQRIAMVIRAAEG